MAVFSLILYSYTTKQSKFYLVYSFSAHNFKAEIRRYSTIVSWAGHSAIYQAQQLYREQQIKQFIANTIYCKIHKLSIHKKVINTTILKGSYNPMLYVKQKANLWNSIASSYLREHSTSWKVKKHFLSNWNNRYISKALALTAKEVYAVLRTTGYV